jgi:UDP-N-acetylglucosamine--N-acetylmuramyl-(pentapeptide) pyrophosphoryl-undecaprenol N-acetylglucosamine transferase
LTEAVIGAIESLSNQLAGWRIVHQTGPRLVESVRDAYVKQGIDAQVQPFFDDMAARYRAASLVISRAGATSIAELTCSQLPMILLPYRHAADHHQLANAKSLQQHGAAIVVEHGSTTTETAEQLSLQLQRLLSDESLRRKMSDAARMLAVPDAASRVADEIESLVKR